MNVKRVLATGSGTYIDKGIAEAFIDKTRKVGGKAKAFQADFDDVDQVKALGEEAIDFLGGIDVLVNNAGLSINIPLRGA